MLVAASLRNMSGLQISSRMRMKIGQRTVVKADIEFLSEAGPFALQRSHQNGG